MEAWRAQLWLQAMAHQGQSDAEAAARLQHCFSSTRLDAFRFGEGVEAMVQGLQVRPALLPDLLRCVLHCAAGTQYLPLR